MLKTGDVVWESGGEPSEISYSNKSAQKGRQNHSKTKNLKPAKKKNSPPRSDTVFESSRENGLIIDSQNIPNGTTLKDLNPQDKQKIAQLIKELAKVGEEKENVVSTLNEERHKFLSHVRQLEDEKHSLMNKQKFLAEEVKQCQTLLQYYQNLITMQQTTLMAQEESKKEPELLQSSLPENSVKNSSGTFTDGSSEPIRINEMRSNSESDDSSFTEDEVLRMTDRQYKAYLRRKKEKLKKEQESLQKLLSLKLADDSHMALEDIQVSPVRDDKSSVSTRSVPVQTFSPLDTQKTLSYASPTRSIGRNTPNRTTNTSRLSTTVKNSTTSPDRLLHMLSEEVAEENLQKSLRYSPKPLVGQESNLSLSSSDVGIATNVMNCDDSQLLQDIFFV